MKHGIRIFLGTIFRSREIATLDMTSTKVVASPIPKPFSALLVTARVGHVPKIRTRTGLDLHNPSVKMDADDCFSLIVHLDKLDRRAVPFPSPEKLLWS